MKREIIKKLALLILATIMCLSFCACSSSKIEPKPGTWEGNTYKNESTNLTFTIDHTCHKLTPEEMKEVIGTTNDIIINGSNDTKEELENGQKYYLYDCMILLEDRISSVTVYYSNIPSTISDISEKDLLEEAVKQMTSLTNVNYKFVKYGDAIIAGDEYKTAELELILNGVSSTVTMYTRFEKGCAICFSTTISKSSPTLGTDFLAKVQHIK